MSKKIITKLSIYLGNSQLNTVLSGILPQNDIAPVYLFFIISTTFICSQGNIGTNISELPMWSREDIGHQNCVMNIFSNWGFLKSYIDLLLYIYFPHRFVVTLWDVQHAFSTSPKLKFKTVCPALLPNLKWLWEHTVDVQKHYLEVYLFIEKEFSEDKKGCCLLRESQLSTFLKTSFRIRKPISFSNFHIIFEMHLFCHELPVYLCAKKKSKF